MEDSNGSGNRVAGACYLMPFASVATHVYIDMFILYIVLDRFIYMHVEACRTRHMLHFNRICCQLSTRTCCQRHFSLRLIQLWSIFTFGHKNQVVHYVVDGHGSGDPHIGVMQRLVTVCRWMLASLSRHVCLQWRARTLSLSRSRFFFSEVSGLKIFPNQTHRDMI